MHSPMVGPWSGIRPRPTQVPLSDVGHGLSSNIRCATSVESRVFSAADAITLEKVLYKFELVRFLYYGCMPCDIISVM
jgi:hypothetical protein